ncbi:YaiO family outer membrane beta-barrel protein [Sphingomonas sp. S1-29]|uniref:YaiO family outer membrane beta-barrel protein n=1 Tax=Sphingomonas sp. S1-29 TaxID=2991074 RepID=UPI00223EBEE7|nr:YaiO family outer membrane beta-barrel protein [Sphingomonas sp. S1-29]UZK69772.1 YaiO family outer membrane beta-barrel protein [Sphingomonas sp. S1-29]
MLVALALALGSAAPQATVQLGSAGQAGRIDCSVDRYGCASIAYRAGDLEAAKAAIDALLVDRPDDADALLLSGSIALRQDDLVRARVALDRAASVAPDYADVFAARARLALREGKLDAARQEIARLRALAPDHPDAAALTGGLAGASAEQDVGSSAIWTAALDHSISRLSPRAADSWSATQGTLVRRKGPASVALEVEHARRFGTSDLRFQLRSDHRVGRGSVYGAVVATAKPDFRETWGLRAGGFYPVSARIDVYVDGRFSNYGRVNSGSVTMAVRGWSARRDTALRLGLINFVDEAGTYRAGWAADLSHLVSSRISVQTGYARYPETEAGVTRRIDSAFAGGTYRVSDTLSLRVGIDRETRQRSFRRDSATIGLSVGF